MDSTGNGQMNMGGSALVASLRNDPSVWWSWTETAKRVNRLYVELKATIKDMGSGPEAAVEDLADRLSWSFGGAGLCHERHEWRAAARELLAVA